MTGTSSWDDLHNRQALSVRFREMSVLQRALGGVGGGGGGGPMGVGGAEGGRDF